MNLNKVLKNIRKLGRKFLRNPASVQRFFEDLAAWRLLEVPPWKIKLEELYPCVGEQTEDAGNARGHYFLQDLWAAQHVARLMPHLHVDVGSLTTGFVAHVASFTKVEYIDIRPLRCQVPNLFWREGSLTKLPFENDSVSSLSCLHVIEHVGLGRYGDPIDVDGWKKGLLELQRVLKPGGQLLVGTPCGRPRVQFNAHRVFDPSMLILAFEKLSLLEFSLIDSDEALSWQSGVDPISALALEYGCGLFRFTK